MAISEVSICNSALIKLGNERISALSENNARARLCNEQYPKLRNEVLVSAHWNFAITRVELAKLSTAPEFGFTTQFQLPSDCLRVIDTNLSKSIDVNDDTMDWAVEGRLLLCNSSSIKIRYIKEVTDTSVFSPQFADALSYRIAAELAYGLKLSNTLMEQMEARYDRAIKNARSYDAQEGSPQRIMRDSFILSRI